MRPKDVMGPVFAHPTKVLCVYMHNWYVNANSACSVHVGVADSGVTS